MAKKISQFNKKSILNNDDLVLVCTNQGNNGLSSAASIATVSSKVGQILNVSNYSTKTEICSTLNNLEVVNVSSTDSLTLAASTSRQQSDNTSSFKTLTFASGFPSALQSARFYLLQLSYNLEPTNIESISSPVSNFNSYLRFTVNSINFDVGLKDFTLRNHAPRHFCKSYLIQKDVNSKFLGQSDTSAEIMVIHDSVPMAYDAGFKLEIISSFSNN